MINNLRYSNVKGKLGWGRIFAVKLNKYSQIILCYSKDFCNVEVVLRRMKNQAKVWENMYSDIFDRHLKFKIHKQQWWLG